ncbi:MAG: helix-turn-helix domain-containing protein [Candidatus Coproplasma sp.]
MKSVTEQIKEYISEHLNEPVTLNDIAKAVGYSKFHTSRIFKEETGLSLFEYIRRERLTASAFALRGRGEKVLDIALDFMFDSHEGFTRAFANGFGITPKKFAKMPAPDGWMIPYYYLNRQKAKTEEVNMEQKTAVIFTQIMERPARKLILFRSKKATNYFEYCEEVGCGTPDNPAPWDILCGIKDALNEPMGVWLPESMCTEGTGIYAHAVEVAADYSGEIPTGFDVVELPACKYMVFQGEPYDDENYVEAVSRLWGNIANFNPKVYGYEWDDETAPKFQLAPMGWRGYIEGRAVKAIANK